MVLGDIGFSNISSPRDVYVAFPSSAQVISFPSFVSGKNAHVQVWAVLEFQHNSTNVFTRMGELMNECLVERTGTLKVA